MSRYRIVQSGKDQRLMSLVGLIEWIVSILARDDFTGITIERRSPAVVVTIVREKG